MEQLEIDYVPVDCEFVCVTRNGGVDYYKKDNSRLLRWKKSTLSWRESICNNMSDLYDTGHKIYSIRLYLLQKPKCHH